MKKLKCWMRHGRSWINENKNKRIWIERTGVIVFRGNNMVKTHRASTSEKAKEWAMEYMEEHDTC